MAGVRLLLFIIIALSFLPYSASAQNQCGGSLEQSDFGDQIRALNEDIQKNVINYRKLQAEAAGYPRDSEEAARAKTKLAAMKGRLQKQKKEFQELNSPHFPRTQLTAWGAACNDRRWVELAKEKLMEEPKYRGQSFHIWLDKKTRKPRAATARPAEGAYARK